MSLPRCIKGIPAAPLAMLAATLLLGACGGGSLMRPDDSGTVREPMPGADRDSPVQIRPEVPLNVQRLFDQATFVMASGDYRDAEIRFREFLQRYPEYPGAHVNLAIIHLHNGNNEAAQASIDAALSLDGNYAPALNQQGMLFRKDGKFNEAEAAYMKAVTASPDYALAYYNLGVLNELYLQRLDTALQHFEQYQSLVGNDELVEKWITDLRRRVEAAQSTANVAD